MRRKQVMVRTTLACGGSMLMYKLRYALNAMRAAGKRDRITVGEECRL